jgi:TATA-box binding protein (TBP) (component of TFIID and TFIIIB)
MAQFNMPETSKSTIDQQFAHMVRHRSPSGFALPRISTATIVCSLNKSYVCLETLGDNPDLAVRTRKSKGKKPYRPFSNSITLVFDETKTIKVFSNGTLHLTGCTTVGYAERLVFRLIDLARWEGVRIKDSKILTLNTACNRISKKSLALDTLFGILKKKHRDVRYTPDIYQALILKEVCPKTGRKITLLCFYTGSLIICGVRDPHELDFGFRIAERLFPDVGQATLGPLP